MATYIYETLSEPARQFEIQQSMKDAPLTQHPETGEPIRRVISGGFGFIEKGKVSSAPAAPRSSGSCGAGCGCH